MARDEVRIRRKAAEIRALALEVERAAKEALKKAAAVVKFQVIDKTPRWRGGLVQAVKIREEEDGRRQLVYGEGVVFRVHERNAQWSRIPPHAPIKLWVEGKLGIASAESDSVAWAIQQKIKKLGLTLPNKEGRGQMIRRTKDLMRRTRFHFQAFASALKSLLRKD
jgi:hypothetical protein